MNHAIAEQRAPVAEYVRMSTDHQRYSIDNQRAALAEYAEANAMRIVRSYADQGCSGLTIASRRGLQALLQDVNDPFRPFNTILVYDVSRWGRFQDADESAYYEYILRRAGASVIYCAEPFENDGSPLSTIVKSVKRAMAAEFSRELSAKVAAGQRRMAERGYRTGSHAGYGLRRMVVSEDGQRRIVLQRGERKSVQTDRVILVPGPEGEVRTVRRIFALYVHNRIGPRRIARQLAEEDAPAGVFPKWYGGAVDKILTNEKYVGVNVFGKQTCKLRGKRVFNPSTQWVRVVGAFEPILDRALFDAAQGLRRKRDAVPTNDELLEGLRRILRRAGRITGALIQEDPELPSINYYCERFGSLREAYARIGYRGRRGEISDRGVPNARLTPPRPRNHDNLDK